METDNLNIPNDQKKQVPNTPKCRIKELMELPLNQKKNFVPGVGARLRMGPFIYEIAVTNPSQLRFTAKLTDVVIEDVTDGKSPIIDPNTGDNFVKED